MNFEPDSKLNIDNALTKSKGMLDEVILTQRVLESDIFESILIVCV